MLREESAARKKIDINNYLSAVFCHKDRVDELVPVAELIDQRKRARVEADVAMGINSPRTACQPHAE